MKKTIAWGRQLFTEIGCANCHELKQQNKQLASTLKATSFQELQSSFSAGCLADTPAGNAPNYQLNKEQRSAIMAGLQSTESQTSAAKIKHSLATFNCYACHERGALGGVTAERNDFFRSSMAEMGDEGRLPPPLDGVGSKLKASWLKEVFDKGAKDRPYMFTRMPQFGSQNVGHLINELKVVDGKVKHEPVTPTLTQRKMKIYGRQIVGSKGLSCIKCHTFNNIKATGIQAISLTSMHQRLEPDWFHEYILNPQKFRRGTRMPAAWPEGQSFLPDILAGETDQQIHATWIYLADGNKAVTPEGLQGNIQELLPTDSPLIYRNFIEGAGSRAIGVGYPEQVNLAFDANQLRLALLWHGKFMDAGRHWSGRGQGFQPPLGVNRLQLPERIPFAQLEDETSAWPQESAREIGYQFQGYRLSKGHPIFLYECGDLNIEDHFQPENDKEFAALNRILTLRAERKPTDWYYLIAQAEKIVDNGKGSFQIDDWKLKVESPEAKPILRKQNNKMELLLKVSEQAAQEDLMIHLRYEW